MTRVLVVSGDVVGPKMAGPGIRALEMARALADAGLRPTLAVPAPTAIDPGVPVVDYARPERLRAALAGSDALVAGGMTLAQLPLLARTGLPVAVDLYAPYILENLSAASAAGPMAAERARRHASDLAALDLHLRRGDFFVCASEVQRDFWLGMLAAAGRLNPAVHARDPELRGLIDVVPFGLPCEPPRSASAVARGVWPGIGLDDEIVLWGGGLWDWLDPVTLVEAAALLRDRDRLRVLFLAGRVPSPGVGPMVAGDRARARSDELGLTGRRVVFRDEWIAYDGRGGLLLEADVGASLHLPHIESRYAYRTRLLDCFWAGLPVVVTGGDVLSDLVARRGLGRVVAPTDARAVASALREMLDLPGGKGALADRFDPVRSELSWRRVVAPLVAWLREPARAADLPTVADRVADTPAWRLPARALRVLRRQGPAGLAAEMARYRRWRRRPR